MKGVDRSGAPLPLADGYRSLSADEQAQLRGRLDDLMALSPEDRARFDENARRWEAMPEAERAHRRAQLRRLRAMDPDERARLLDELLERSETAPPPAR